MRRLFVLAVLSVVLSATISVIDAEAQPDPLAGVRIEPEAMVSYDRPTQYGGWIRMNAPYNRCFSVRDQVLADESTKSRFRFKQPTGGGWRCVVTVGSWSDPYTGTRFTDPRELDIDHVVPLREAHVSGAYAWSKAKRIEYANFLRDPQHLIAVAFSENRKKGDKDPPEYMPPRGAYHCTYLRIWTAIKLRWDLTMDQAEATFVRQRLAAC